MDYYVFKEDRSHNKKTRTIFLIFSGIILLVGGAIYWFLFSYFWKVQSFTIQGRERVTEERIIFLLKKNIRTNSFIRWPEKTLIIENEPLIDHVDMTKNWWDRSIDVKVFERKTYGVWCQYDHQCFWFDAKGIIIDKAPRPKGGLIAVLEEAKPIKRLVGDSLIDTDSFKVISMIIDSWIFDNIVFESMIIDREKREIRAKTTEGLLWYFSLRSDPTNNILALKKLNEEKNIHINDLEYIDLRIENKIYYQ